MIMTLKEFMDKYKIVQRRSEMMRSEVYSAMIGAYEAIDLLEVECSRNLEEWRHTLRLKFKTMFTEIAEKAMEALDDVDKIE